MSEHAPSSPRGRPAPMLVLCRQCVEYVFAGTTICRRDARAIGARYRNGGYQASEAMRRIDEVADRRKR